MTRIPMIQSNALRSIGYALAVSILTLGLSITGVASAQTPLMVGYQGAFFDAAGDPAAGPADVDVALFDAANGGSELYAETHDDVPLVDGTFDLQIGSGAGPVGSFDADTFSSAEVWLELTVDGEVLTPRQRLVAVPYALRAAVAERLDGAIGTVPHALTADRLAGVSDGIQNPISDMLTVNIDQDGQVFDDGARVYFDHGFLGGTTQDALVIEKTDSNGSDPDGGIVFSNRGSDLVSETSMVIDGAGNIGIPVVHSSARVHIESTDQRGMNIWADHSQKALEVSNVGTGEGLVVAANGIGRQRAVVRVRADNPNDGVAGYFYNESTAGTMYLHNTGPGAALVLQNSGGDDLISAWDWSDGSATAKRFWVDSSGATNVRTLKIHGGADLSEKFEVSGSSGVSVEPGTVLAIDPEASGKLTVSGGAYARTVAGVVAGAGGIEPGLLLHQEGVEGADGDHAVAITGRVYVKADAANGPIRPGDLLTTSERPGHAMRVDDWQRSQGAVLGKAMTRLDEGTGLVLVLIGLQ